MSSVMRKNNYRGKGILSAIVLRAAATVSSVLVFIGNATLLNLSLNPIIRLWEALFAVGEVTPILRSPAFLRLRQQDVLIRAVLSMEECERLDTKDEYLDNETGEICQAVTCLRSERVELDVREPQVEKRRKKKFHVPISYVQGDWESRRRKKKGLQHHQKKLHVDCIEESVIHGTHNVSPIVFMLPTLLICPAWTSIFCVICETCIHMLSHKRNKMRKYETDYKSPLHLVSSQFCGYCRSHRWKEKIKQIQDKRTLRRKLTGGNLITT